MQSKNRTCGAIPFSKFENQINNYTGLVENVGCPIWHPNLGSYLGISYLMNYMFQPDPSCSTNQIDKETPEKVIENSSHKDKE